MREIKFRAWDKKHKEMCDVTQIRFITPFGEPAVEMFHELTTDYSEDSINSTDLMQYTGLKDKNGKEIYEGDIIWVHIPGLKGHIYCVVEFTDGCFDIRAINAATFGRDYLKCFTCNHAVEVIGNIYENPELLAR